MAAEPLQMSGTCFLKAGSNENLITNSAKWLKEFKAQHVAWHHPFSNNHQIPKERTRKKHGSLYTSFQMASILLLNTCATD